MTVKMEEIAKLCKVSRATISYVLNDKPNSRISKATREKILKTAKKLGYKRKKIYKVVPHKKIKIAFVIASLSEYSESNHLFVFSDLMRGISDGFQNSGYNPEVQLFSFDLLEKEKTIQMIDKFKANGIIFLEAQNALEILPQLNSKPYLVLYDSEAIGKNLNYLAVDDKKAACLAVEYLIKIGHRKIGFFSFYLDSWCMKERLKGYKETLKNHNIPYDESLVRSGKKEKMRDELKKLLKRKPTAIFTASDLVAVLIMENIKKEGFSIPKDISIVGFSDLPIASQIEPLLTTVRKPRYEIGYESAKILTNWDGKKLIQKMWKPELIVRNSTKNRR